MISRDEKFAKLTELLQTLHRIRFSDVLEGGREEENMCLPEFAVVLCIDMMKDEGREHVLVSDLVKALPSSPQAISKYLKQLEKRELIRRLSVRSDRRSTEIEITGKGKEALDVSRERMDKFFSDIFSGVSDEEFDSMFSFMNNICDAMVKRSNAVRVSC